MFAALVQVMTTQNRPAVLLRTKDVMAWLHVSRKTLERWRQSGDFPQPMKLGARTLAWRREAVEDWLDSRRVDDPADAPF